LSDPAKRTNSAAGGGGREIVLLNPNRYPEAAARRLRPWLAALLAALAPEAGSLGVRFTGDREMRRVNRQFRGKDQPTDVLSFPGDDGHLGDLLISVPTARRQAAAAGHGVERELKTLLLHGVLHCLGHDHETDQGEMERLERRLRKVWLDENARLDEPGEGTHAS
jgi:probable rRNA maturation factor